MRSSNANQGLLNAAGIFGVVVGVIGTGFLFFALRDEDPVGLVISALCVGFGLGSTATFLVVSLDRGEVNESG